MPTQLPKPKRYVAEDLLFNSLCFYIHADADVFTFLSLLAPISKVNVWENGKQAKVDFDARYAYDGMTCLESYLWVLEQLEQEFGGTEIPAKSQEA